MNYEDNKKKNTKELERRAYNFEVRAEVNDEGGSIIVGRPIVYDSVTDLGFCDEVIERGALDMANLNDVRFLVNHDLSRIPLARSRRNNGNSTMQLTVNESGMDISVLLDTENNSEARALYSAVQRGDISGMSFMFSVDDEEWENLNSDHPTRRIRKIGSVVEVSAVTFPAYSETSIQIRAKCKEALDNARSALESARQQNAKLPEGSKDELSLLKEKIKLL